MVSSVKNTLFQISLFIQRQFYKRTIYVCINYIKNICLNIGITAMEAVKHKSRLAKLQIQWYKSPCHWLPIGGAMFSWVTNSASLSGNPLGQYGFICCQKNSTCNTRCCQMWNMEQTWNCMAWDGILRAGFSFLAQMFYRGHFHI